MWLRPICTVLAVAFVSSAAPAAIINVPDPKNGIFSIQDGIDAAVDGDEVIVRPVEWFETINLSGKAITLRSIDPAVSVIVMATIINGSATGGTVVTCDSGEGPGTVISGFVITGGTSGGMRNSNFSSPTVANCTFSRNSSNFGGGMYNFGGSSPIVTNCLFIRNTVTSTGGGMHNTVGSSPTVQNCTFSINTAFSEGGGMYNFQSSSPTLTNCTFSGNTSGSGGGIFNQDSDPTIINCTVSGNTASGDSGGMRSSGTSNPTVTDSVVCGNEPDQIPHPFTDGGGNIIWPYCAPPQPPACSQESCPGDTDGDGQVGINDFLMVLGLWGPCP